MKSKSYILLSLGFLFISCGNKDQASYDKAMKSNDVHAMKEYLQTNPDAPLEYIDNVTLKLNELINDSIEYKAIWDATDLLTIYNLDSLYLSLHPNGEHSDLISEKIVTDKRAYEQEIKERRERYFNNYSWFIDLIDGYYWDCKQSELETSIMTFYSHIDIMFDIPNENGKGSGVWCKIDATNSLVASFFFFYEVLSNGDIRITVNDTERTQALAQIFNQSYLRMRIRGEDMYYSRVFDDINYKKNMNALKKLWSENFFDNSKLEYAPRNW